VHDIVQSYTRYRQIRDAEVRSDTLFKTALAASFGRSVVLPHKLENLFLTIRDGLKSTACKNIVEFGAFKGGSALFMGYLLRKLHPGAKLYALDTFTGMPETDPTKDLHRAGEFADCDLDGFRRLCSQLELDHVIEIVQGRIEDTWPRLAQTPIGLAHIDVDIYSAVAFAQSAAWGNLCPGGYLIYDDAEYPTCLGATHAAEEFKARHGLLSEQVHPHWVVRKPGS